MHVLRAALSSLAALCLFSGAVPAVADAATLPSGSVKISATNQVDFLSVGKSGKDKVWCRFQNNKSGGIRVGFVKKNAALKKNVWRSFDSQISEINKKRGLSAAIKNKLAAPFRKLKTKFEGKCLALLPTPSPTATPTVTVTPTLTPTSTPTPTPTPAPDGVVSRLNSGGDIYLDSAGKVWSTDELNLVQTSAGQISDHTIVGTADQALYQTYRVGSRLDYEFPLDVGTYDIVLHFAEMRFTAAAQRLFDISIEGAVVQSNVDIFTLAGGADTAYQIAFTTPVNDGFLNLSFIDNSNMDLAEISAIEIRPTGALPAQDDYRIDCGWEDPRSDGTLIWNEEAVGNELRYLFGAAGSRTAPTAIAGTTDPVLFQSERFGKSFAYAIPVANGNYEITLSFAETFWTLPGQRIFNVSLESTPVLTNFDLLTENAAPGTAIEKTFQISVADSQLDINFLRVADNASIAAVKVKTLP